ncbi:magnesium transporter [Maritalea sp. S77]|jgi:magnesium transporter|uniref:magnesium transporter n=1 Tax=Maritalea sp. S77 TaxID=3415125 RepID=UPI003C7E2752
MSNAENAHWADDAEMDVIPPLRDEDDRLNRDWIDQLVDLIAIKDENEVARYLAPLHASDVGDVLEAISAADRFELINLLGDLFDYSALTEVDDAVRLELMELLPNTDIARGVQDLDSDDAVYILEDIGGGDREEILEALPTFERLALKRSLDFPEETAGRRMQTEFIAIPPFWTVGQTIDYMREADDLPDDFHQIYVVDPSYNLLGTLALDRMLRAKRPAVIKDIMNSTIIEVEAEEDQEEAARVFERYDLVEVAVVDDTRRLVGVLTVDDIVDVIQEEAGEDIKRLAGVGNEEISGNVWNAVRSRLTWLGVNLVTAILASLVIGMFDATIQQMVALAVLMPIVASMGGNAGTQTMTVAVRALSTRELDSYNVRRLITREFLVGVVNGVVFAVVIGVVAAVWFANPLLGLVIGTAMVINMIAAGVSGILIPLGLDKLKIDPAIASSAFVTTVTDVVGFMAFLYIAAMAFNLF